MGNSDAADKPIQKYKLYCTLTLITLPEWSQGFGESEGKQRQGETDLRPRLASVITAPWTKPEVSPRRAVKSVRFLVGEGADSRSLVVLHIEDGIELGDLEQVMHLFGQVQQLQFAALTLDGSECAHQLTDT